MEKENFAITGLACGSMYLLLAEYTPATEENEDGESNELLSYDLYKKENEEFVKCHSQTLNSFEAEIEWLNNNRLTFMNECVFVQTSIPETTDMKFVSYDMYKQLVS